MSIASEISRLQSAKSDIAGAIADKGVSVPASARLDDYAGLIEQISGGGGGGGTVLVPTAGDYPVVESAGVVRVANSNVTSTGISITIPVSGTYRLKWTAFRSNTSNSYINGSQLYRTRNNNTEAIGTENTSWTQSYYQSNILDIACEAGDVITVYARSRSASYYVFAGNLSACVDQKMWTN